jgi:hypothetical protein
VTEPLTDSELAQHFRNNAVSSMPRAPLNAALSRTVAEDPDLRAILLHAPPAQQLPVLLLAAVHATVLELSSIESTASAGARHDTTPHELIRWFPNLTDDARSADDRRLPSVLRDFIGLHRERIVELVSTRQTQTNEVGRSALLLVGMGIIAGEVARGDVSGQDVSGQEVAGQDIGLAHLDVGSSGGLNLLIDRLSHRYVRDSRAARTDAGVVVGGPSEVELVVHTRGDVALPERMPDFVARCGIDRRPVDITDDDEARWLEACVWPDQIDRFERLRAVIDIARQSPPELLAGDAIESLEPAIERMSRAGHVVVTNSWVLNYLHPDERVAYTAELDRLGTSVDLSWVFLESPGLTPELPWGAAPIEFGLTALNLVRWRDGARSVDHLAVCHPHGYWMHWSP